MTFITVETTVAADAATVWCAWTLPEHIMQWTHASDDWHAPAAENDLRVSGRFKTTMAAKDGSFSFDFTGTTRSSSRSHISPTRSTTAAPSTSYSPKSPEKRTSSNASKPRP